MLCLKSDDSIRRRSDEYRNIDPGFLLEIYRKKCIGCYNDKESTVEAKAFLTKFYRIDAITWKEYIEYFGTYYD